LAVYQEEKAFANSGVGGVSPGVSPRDSIATPGARGVVFHNLGDRVICAKGFP